MSFKPSLDKRCAQARSLLSTPSQKTGISVIQHVTNLIQHLLNEKPKNGVDVIEGYKFDPIKKSDEESDVSKLAHVQKFLFLRDENEEELADTNEDIETPLPNLLELSYFFEQGEIGIGSQETFRMWLSLKKLVDKYPLETIRFWGKILGLNANYYVAEVQFQEGKDELEEEEELEEEKKEEEEEKDPEEDVLPKILYKPPPKPPKEDVNTGCNKYVYFVCSSPGAQWTRLPPVTPSQIQLAKKIKKFFTGDLNAEIESNPPFIGTEANYLRAQIARISASTHISPSGFYISEGEAEEEEESGGDVLIKNEEFEGLSPFNLTDTSNWVHHVKYILPQGRTKWWNPKEKKEDEEEAEEDEEKEDALDLFEAKPETGPRVLTSIAQDSTLVNGLPAWTTRMSSNFISQYGICVVRSNLWPGAYAFGTKNKFENIYIGWGHKYVFDNYNPHLPEQPLAECQFDLQEQEDPSPLIEAQHQRQAEEAKGDGEEEGEEELDEDA